MVKNVKMAHISICILGVVCAFFVVGAASASEDICSEHICLTADGVYLTVSDTGGNTIKKAELSSSVQKILLGPKRFFVVTPSHIYVLNTDGQLLDKVFLQFKPQATMIMGNGLMIKKDDDLRLRLIEQDEKFSLEPVIGKLGQKEVFVAEKGKNQFVFFYPDRIVYPDDSVKNIVVLEYDDQKVTYIDEDLNFVKRDIEFNTKEIVDFTSQSFTNYQGFAEVLPKLNISDVEKFYRLVTTQKFLDKILAEYINIYLDEQNLPNDTIQFYFDLLPMDAGHLTNDAFIDRFNSFSDEGKQLCIKRFEGRYYKQKMMIEYAQGFSEQTEDESYTFLFENFPETKSLRKIILKKIYGSFFSLPVQKRKMLFDHFIKGDYLKETPGSIDRLLDGYVSIYLFEESLNQFNFSYFFKNAGNNPGVRSKAAFITQFNSFKDNSNKQKVILNTPKSLFREELVSEYAIKLQEAAPASQYQFVIDHFPYNEKLRSKLLRHYKDIILSLPDETRHLLLTGFYQKKQLKPFMALMINDISNLSNEQPLLLIERYYHYLSKTEEHEVLASLVSKFGVSLPSPYVSGDIVTHYPEILMKVNEFFLTPEYRHILRFLDFSLHLDSEYYTEGNSPGLYVQADFNGYIDLFTIRLEGSCTLENQYEEKGSYTEFALWIVPTGETEAMYDVKEYSCSVNKKAAVAYQELMTELKQHSPLLTGNTEITGSWQFKEKNITQRLNTTPNWLGEQLAEVFSPIEDHGTLDAGALDCMDMHNACKDVFCENLDDSVSIFPLDPSENSQCRGDCGDAYGWCYINDRTMIKHEICSAKCRGAEEYYDCKDDCTSNDLGAILQQYNLQ